VEQFEKRLAGAEDVRPHELRRRLDIGLADPRQWRGAPWPAEVSAAAGSTCMRKYRSLC
jgi:hypothetical protein